MDSSQRRVWTGASDQTRKLPGEFFIPKSLQGDFLAVSDYLSGFVSEQRRERFLRVASERSRFVAPVFENTHHVHNISAILRTSDALGFQDAFFCYTLKDMHFRLKDGVERGASAWLSPRRATSMRACAELLKACGYAVALVSLPSFERTSDHYRGDLPSFAVQDIVSAEFEAVRARRKLALVFGNELHGVSEEWTEHADLYLHVDMHGFVESLNVSVCAGILLNALRRALDARESETFRVNADERGLLLDHWFARSVTNAPDLVRVHHPEVWSYFDFVRKGLFYDPFDNLTERKPGF